MILTLPLHKVSDFFRVVHLTFENTFFDFHVYFLKTAFEKNLYFISMDSTLLAKIKSIFSTQIIR